MSNATPQVEVRTHTIDGALAAVEVRSLASVGACVATAKAAWPEHAGWLENAWTLGDFLVHDREHGGTTWFFCGAAGEELAEEDGRRRAGA